MDDGTLLLLHSTLRVTSLSPSYPPADILYYTQWDILNASLKNLPQRDLVLLTSR